MTRKEAIYWLRGFIWHEGEDVPIYDTDIEAIHMAIKALKQESILDKIQAEIIDTGAYEQETMGHTEFLKGINYCLDVINKHKTESEVEDRNDD